MKKLVTTALALVAAGTATKADPGDDEWLELDREINSLASSLKPSQDGMGWAALIRTFYTYSTDNILNPGGLGEDVSGLHFKDVDLATWGTVGDYGWRINADIDDGSPDTGGSDTSLTLEDAHAWWNCGDYFITTLGRQKPRLLRSGWIDPEKTLFADRSGLGSSLDLWDSGIQANGVYDAFGWWFGIFNGFDDEQVDHVYAFRAEWNLGAGAGMGEGALGGNDDLNGTIGFSYKMDDTQDGGLPVNLGDDANAWFLDIVGSVGPLGFGFEYADLDDDEFLLVHDEDYLGELLEAQGGLGSATTFVPDSSPWNIWASWLINPEWEVGLRWEEMDNDDYSHPLIGGTGSSGPDNSLLSAVVAYYQVAHNAKWQVQWTDVSADSGFDDGSILQLGLTVGMTR